MVESTHEIVGWQAKENPPPAVCLPVYRITVPAVPARRKYSPGSLVADTRRYPLPRNACRRISRRGLRATPPFPRVRGIPSSIPSIGKHVLRGMKEREGQREREREREKVYVFLVGLKLIRGD